MAGSDGDFVELEGGEVRRLRLHLRHTRKSLAAASRVSEDTIRQIERGKRTDGRTTRVKMVNAVALAEVLSVDISHICKRDEKAVNQRRMENSVTGETKASWNLDHPTATESAFQSVRPPRPESVLGRDKELGIIKGHLSQSGRVVVCGLPGIGKTTVACELAWLIGDEFKDGVFWTSLGPHLNESQVLHKLKEWARQCAMPEANLLETIDIASNRLRETMADRRALLLIDDAWQVSQALPFCVGGGKCGMLVTTRSIFIAENLWPKPAARYKLEGLNEEDSLALLRENAGDVVDTHIDQCRQLVKRLDGLPVALYVAGKMLSSQQARGSEVSELIDEISTDVSPLLARIAPTRHGYVAQDASASVFALIDKSYQYLEADVRKCYARLSVFPPSPALIRFIDIQSAFELNERSTKDAIDRLVDAGLLEPAEKDQEGQARYRVHALIVAHACSIDWSQF